MEVFFLFVHAASDDVQVRPQRNKPQKKKKNHKWEINGKRYCKTALV